MAHGGGLPGRPSLSPEVRSGVTRGALKKVGKCGDQRGTTIHFMPDTQIFDDLNFNFSTLSQRLREVAFLNRSLRITLTDEREEVGRDRRARGR